jgi:phenylacetic acid degradation operon negative regulatory protein
MYRMIVNVPNVLNHPADDPRLLMSEPFRAVHYVFGLFFPDIPALPGRALLRTLGTLGFGEEAARGIVLRLRRRGFLVSRPEGREAAYELAPVSYRLIDAMSRRATQPPPAWDGSFETLLVHIPPAKRAFREQLRRQAAFAGFGTPLPSLLVAADSAATLAIEPLLVTAPAGVTVIRARLTMDREDGRRLARDAWSLEPLADRIVYETARMAAVSGQVDGRTVPDAEAVALMWRTIGPYFALLSEARPLPADLLPDDWPLSRAHAAFQGLALSLAEPARRYVEELAQR